MSYPRLRSRRTRTAVAALVATIAALSASHPSATASTIAASRFHLALKRAEPGVNDTVTASPALLKLWFTESVQAAATSVRLSGPGDHPVSIGEVTVDAAPLSPAIAKVGETLGAGTYVVAWKTMAADGHPSSGKFSFTIRAAEAR